MVVVDANHRWAGQTLEVEVELVAIQAPGALPENRELVKEDPTYPGTEGRGGQG
jgi:FKBP-type peptidyl-prolyl cis-trans isomerase 2